MCIDDKGVKCTHAVSRSEHGASPALATSWLAHALALGGGLNQLLCMPAGGPQRAVPAELNRCLQHSAMHGLGLWQGARTRPGSGGAVPQPPVHLSPLLMRLPSTQLQPKTLMQALLCITPGASHGRMHRKPGLRITCVILQWIVKRL